ncbi:MAG: ArsR family transcriptional regulator [Micrococcales bacterium 70-64]|nr:helix-turn-helix domain-containing protein [Leifsonia sp.]ODU65319.1 MAG: ArsR family transcriptional regulator [Leifsonia sp. SCN 70-46]OJX87011.1 MAG: ArsR family transcriptional regulator [Micrococcales bacterium 70-64]
MPGATTPHSQTLSRGIRVLEVLAESPLTIQGLAQALDVHRSIVYRILRTLEDHGLVARDAAGLVSLAPRMAALARGVERNLQSAALPELTAAANDLGATTFLVTLDHAECVTLLSVEPRAGATVAQRPGTRHPLSVGAPGIAIQSLLADAQLAGTPRRPLDARGWASSHDEVIAGLSSVAVPLALPGSAPSAIAAVFVAGSADADAVGARLLAARDAILL